MNSLVRYLEGNKADDVLNPRSKLLQINVFSTDSILGKGSSGKYGFGALTYNNGTDVVLNFPSKFTVCFQAKFVDKGFEDTAFGNLISVVFNDTILICIWSTSFKVLVMESEAGNSTFTPSPLDSSYLKAG